MIIVISNPVSILNEAVYINALFEAGLEVFHLRKPTWNEYEYRGLLELIDGEYYPRVALHQFHEIAVAYGINRLHFTESARISMLNLELSSQMIYSTSIHNGTEVNEVFDVFDYCFYGPVFDSISKEGYSKMEVDNSAIIRTKYKKKLIGIGGVNDDNVNYLKEKGYDGAAVLGAIWSNPERAVSTYLKVKENW